MSESVSEGTCTVSNASCVDVFGGETAAEAVAEAEADRFDFAGLHCLDPDYCPYPLPLPHLGHGLCPGHGVWQEVAD